MNRSIWWLLPVGLILLVAGVGIGAAVADHHHDDNTVRVVTTTDGTGTAGQPQVITIDRDGRWGHGWGFFPGFFLFPLLWIGLIVFVFGGFRRRRWGGPGGGDGRMEDWHRRQHENPPAPPTGPATT